MAKKDWAMQSLISGLKPERGWWLHNDYCS